MNELWSQRKLASVAKRLNDHRSPFQRDRARILHSAAFRRLQSKTQVMGSGQSDFYRTRLTHSLEAAQIGSGISAQLRNKHAQLSAELFPDDENLIESICLAHDIGHPPFGHGGEVALNYMMRNHGGFEGNGQTFRIVSHLEPFSEFYGMNLSRRTLLGLIKYPQLLTELTQLPLPVAPHSFRQLKAADWHPAKGLYSDDTEMFDWVLSPLSADDRALFQSIKKTKNKHNKTIFKSLDCSIMELADDIAYGIHDLEDAIVTGVVSQQDFEQEVITKLKAIDEPWLQDYCQRLTAKLFNEQHYIQKEAIGGLVNYLITEIYLADLNENSTISFTEPLLRYNAKLPVNAAKALQIFKDFVFSFVIKQTSIQQLEYRGQQIVMELFEALASDPARLLPKHTKQRWLYAKTHNLNEHRVIADYVSGMTDDYATHLYQRLFLPSGSSRLSER
ncbi:deoxyguanosinetriphosphate triphosphohydrolase family protein [Colwellia sp. BRX8-4]|jgi:dGTPase|uniref:anti-phage deoxyguanosine triphosphatase n=1 Tax=unclassified Colwellia TaxID=196834 RepID=UPI0015F504D2|nr:MULTISPECIES: anti-phage deoxyguanosine triphosphatase [unclassified Colwellia]MBA6353306.1 deoxyguanosinetriphosphate triphosphohydrolase family protein [Colwellia sp. BRX9-1]MBA6363416.1 deoxyguanosinetriphosphate triphosphohydrolase family protein [Colwellia sp. BRX8-8]MBA6371423.1 deoxyguanosinetriphosphate triphosphohydrolase family protein [Colwellia sp. BRX8-4]